MSSHDMSTDHEAVNRALGVYSLGQLDDPDELAVVRRHLPTCETCRSELDDLAEVAAALRGVRAAGPGEIDAPPKELDRRISEVLAGLSGRRTRRWVPAAVGVLVGAVAASIVAVAVLGGDLPAAPARGPEIIAVPRVDVSPGVEAQVGLVDHTWGLELKLKASGLPAGETYDVQVTGRDGRTYEAGEFIGVGDRTVSCNLGSAVLYDDATSFTVRTSDGRDVIWADLPT